MTSRSNRVLALCFTPRLILRLILRLVPCRVLRLDTPVPVFGLLGVVLSLLGLILGPLGAPPGRCGSYRRASTTSPEPSAPVLSARSRSRCLLGAPRF